MSARILVTGGTGTLGRQLVPRLLAAGADVRVLSRHGRPSTAADGAEYVTGDLLTGEGVVDATDGAATIVHCAGGRRGDDLGTRNLAAAAAMTGARHLVFISVVGADRIPVVSALDQVLFGYFGMKHDAERAVAGSGVPWTTLRATQFHDLTLTTVRALARLPVIPVPAGMRFQPVDTGEVADRLADLALGAPAGLVPDLAGPTVYPLADLVLSYLRARGLTRPLVPVPVTGRAARALRAGAALAPEHATGKRTWEDFLADRVPVPA